MISRMSGLKPMIMALMILPILLAPAVLLKEETETPLLEPHTITGHIEYVQPTFIEHSEPRLVEQGVWVEYIDFGGRLEGSPAGGPSFVVYGNKLGPYQPSEMIVEMKTLSPTGHPLTVTIIIDGKSTWTSAFEPEPHSEYVLVKSPVLNCNGGTVYVAIQNDNTVAVTYTTQITLIYR